MPYKILIILKNSEQSAPEVLFQ